MIHDAVIAIEDFVTCARKKPEFYIAMCSGKALIKIL